MMEADGALMHSAAFLTQLTSSSSRIRCDNTRPFWARDAVTVAFSITRFAAQRAGSKVCARGHHRDRTGSLPSGSKGSSPRVVVSLLSSPWSIWFLFSPPAAGTDVAKKTLLLGSNLPPVTRCRRGCRSSGDKSLVQKARGCYR